MRLFMISILSSSSVIRRASASLYHHHPLNGPRIPRNPTTIFDTPGPQTSWLININKYRCFMSTPTNHHLDTSIRSYIEESNINEKQSEAGVIRIQVISTENIKPSSPTPKNLRHYKLSMFDQFQMPMYNPSMFFYLNKTDNQKKMKIEDVIRDRSNQLKQSLSETLTRLYPFAGKLVGELHIDCNDDGAYYIETRVDDQLENVLKNLDNKLLKRLLPVPNASYVTLIQVNFFNCGGVCITVQHSHKLADGHSSMTFFNTWAAFARTDSSNQEYPNYVWSSMFPQTSNSPLTPYIPLWHLTICPASIKHSKFENIRLVFNASALRELKAKASKHQPVSRVVAVLSLLWKCLITATKFKPSVLQVPVDIRQRLSPPLPDSSIGNIILDASLWYDPDASIVDLASMADHLKNEIGNFIADSIEELKAGENVLVRHVEGTRNATEMLSDYNIESYFVTSMCNSGSTKVDFGCGKPVWFCIPYHLNQGILQQNWIELVDSCSSDGIEACMTLEQHVIAAIKCNDELLSYVSVNPSPL